MQKFWFLPYFLVDERIPAAARDSISASEWKHFCSDVKACYQPMQQHLMVAHFGVSFSMCFFLAGLTYSHLMYYFEGLGTLLVSASYQLDQIERFMYNRRGGILIWKFPSRPLHKLL
jgi:hypothetical protein